MANGHGGSRRGSGRRKGSPNVHKTAFRTALRDYCESINVDPHHFMADMIADDSIITYGIDQDGVPITGPACKPELKLKAAQELAQYLEPKLKSVDVELSGNVEKPLVVHIRRGKPSAH